MGLFFFLIFSLLPVLGAEKANVILFVTDDQSPIAGCYGNSVIQTPHLDALAEEGTMFTQAFATSASCSASRSVILSGHHNHFNGQYGHTHHFHKFESFRSMRAFALPQLMAQAGNRTVQIGKLHVVPESVFHFDQYLKGNSRNAHQMAELCEPVFEEETEMPFFLYFATSDPHRGGGEGQDLHGRSWLPILSETNPEGWDEISASHTFHEIQMYYPMRVIRDRKYKLIWNIAHRQPYPFASDLWVAATWQAQWSKGEDADYGGRTVDSYIHRSQFEFFDIVSDPSESRNLADDPAHAEALANYKDRLKAEQERTEDPWIMKWEYERFYLEALSRGKEGVGKKKARSEGDEGHEGGGSAL